MPGRDVIIAKAVECGYEQMELDVLSRNARAINAIRHKGGTVDVLDC